MRRSYLSLLCGLIVLPVGAVNAAEAAVSSDALLNGKVMVVQNGSPKRPVTLADKVVPADEVKMIDVAGAKPEPMKATPLGGAQVPADATRINGNSGFFDMNANHGVFTDDVVVKNPTLQINCDTLEFFLFKEGGEKKDAAPVTPSATLPGEAPKEKALEDSGIEKAIAQGRKVVIQKLNAAGDLQIGICRHATYEGHTGDIILRDLPQIQLPGRVVTATDSSTYMVLKQNGEFKVEGPHTSIFSKMEKPKESPQASVGR